MAAKKLIFGAAGSCNCKNLCNRNSKRGACPCLSAELFCSEECKCGTVKQTCVNRYGRGGPLDTILGIVQGTQGVSLADNEREDSMILLVGNEEGHVAVNADALNTSMQAAAELEYGATGTAEPTWEFPEVDSVECDPSGLVDKLSSTAAKDTLRKILVDHPQMMTYLSGITQDPPSPHPSQPGAPDWCKCGQCQQMPTPEEQLCCRKTFGPCITVTSAPQINTVVLNLHVLAAAVQNRNDLFALNDDVRSTRTLRHTAYRQYVLWRFGHLGTGNRVIIPSCVVCKIRARYPDPSGQYTGFRSARFN